MGLTVGGDEGGGAVGGIAVPGVGRDVVHRTVIVQPAPIPGDAQQNQVVFGLVQVGDDRMGGLEGHGILRGAAAEEYGNGQFLHQ